MSRRMRLLFTLFFLRGLDWGTTIAYDQEMVQTLGLEKLQAEEITGQLEEYLTQYHTCFGNSAYDVLSGVGRCRRSKGKGKGQLSLSS